MYFGRGVSNFFIFFFFLTLVKYAITNVGDTAGLLTERVFGVFFFSFDMDPTIRVSTVSATLGQLFMSLSMFGCQQNFVQRYFSMDSQKQVEKYVI